jgi:hypothetical protein
MFVHPTELLQPPRQSECESGMVVAASPQEILISVKGYVNLKTMRRPKGLCQLKLQGLDKN